MDAVEGNALLVRLVAAEIGRRLGGLKDGERIEFCNRLLSSIGADGPESQVPVGETKRALLSVYRDASEPPPSVDR